MASMAGGSDIGKRPTPDGTMAEPQGKRPRTAAGLGCRGDAETRAAEEASVHGRRRGSTLMPEAMVPADDAEALLELLEEAKPVVLRRFAAGWPAMTWTFDSLAAAAQKRNHCAAESAALGSPAEVEVQVGTAGSSSFRGYGGTLDRMSLSELPARAGAVVNAERQDGSALEPLYLVQCPIWADGCTAAGCPARHLLEGLRLPQAAFGRLRAATETRPAGRFNSSGLARRIQSVNLWGSAPRIPICTTTRRTVC
eukprot:TRINITY_DN17130_c0_g1_i4.p1 TRINITY_DN17130_c0_g1~~TRINITY_DN17130_c0_g1_i4.p1  ORF type:complete len:254 (-),score=32.59 TRINITY_DN17130_c0_g1_i4:1039-1800(-)